MSRRSGQPQSLDSPRRLASPSKVAGVARDIAPQATGAEQHRRVRGASRARICASGCYMPQVCSGTPAGCRMHPKTYYPLFADLNGRRCIVVGGGMVAQRKVMTLLRAGAWVVVISPTVTQFLARAAQAGRIQLRRRRVRPTDLRGAWLIYAATDDRATNRLVAQTAGRLRVFANIVDQTPLCSFIAPALFRRGPLMVAVSTAGASPSLAKHVRSEVAHILTDVYAPMARLLAELRGVAKRQLPRYEDRKRYFAQLIDGRVFALVRSQRPRQAKQAALALLQRYTAKGRR